MRAGDFRVGWRLLVQQRGASLAVILGLAAGFAACFLLLGFAGYSFGYDSQVPQRERVHLVKQRINLFIRPEWQNYAYLSLRDAAWRSGAVELASIVKQLDLPVRRGERLYPVNVQAVDADFASLFGVTPLQGDLRAALAQPDAVALTQAAARKLFADAPALGQLLQVGGASFQVRAILPDHQRNTSVPYELLVGREGSAWPAAQRDAAFAGTGRGAIYLRLRPGADAGALAALLQQTVNDAPQGRQVRGSSMGRALKGNNVTDLALLPLAHAYFDADLYHSRAAARHGQRAGVAGLAVLALLILALAVINYVNLATVRAVRRQREIGVRKLLGAGASRLVRQFLAESVLTCVLAAGAGLLLAWLALPLFAELVQRPLEAFFTPWTGLGALLFGVLTGARLCQAAGRRGPAHAGGAAYHRHRAADPLPGHAPGAPAYAVRSAPWRHPHRAQRRRHGARPRAHRTPVAPLFSRADAGTAYGAEPAGGHVCGRPAPGAHAGPGQRGGHAAGRLRHLCAVGLQRAAPHA